MPPVVQSLVAGAQVHPRAAAALGPAFVAEERAYTGARCELPTGEVVEVEGRKTPFFALAGNWISGLLTLCRYGCGKVADRFKAPVLKTVATRHCSYRWRPHVADLQWSRWCRYHGPCHLIPPSHQHAR